MPIRHPEIECMPRAELEKLQSERLVAQVARMYEKVECFRKRMDAKGLTPSDIHGIDDLKVGMELPGIVTNITNFGAFVDIGVHQDAINIF